MISKFFSITRTIFPHRRSEQVWKQSRPETKYQILHIGVGSSITHLTLLNAYQQYLAAFFFWRHQNQLSGKGKSLDQRCLKCRFHSNTVFSNFSCRFLNSNFLFWILIVLISEKPSGIILKDILFQKLFEPLTIWIRCSSDLKKKLSECQNNFGNKIQFFSFKNSH